jgi:hypothetical protein
MLRIDLVTNDLVISEPRDPLADAIVRSRA